MTQIQNVDTLTHFKANTAEVLERLKTTGAPMVLTVEGEAQVVVQDAGSYQEMLQLLDRAQAIEGIRRGLSSMERGEGRPADEVFERIRGRHEISRDA